MRKNRKSLNYWLIQYRIQRYLSHEWEPCSVLYCGTNPALWLKEKIERQKENAKMMLDDKYKLISFQKVSRHHYNKLRKTSDWGDKA